MEEVVLNKYLPIRVEIVHQRSISAASGIIEIVHGSVQVYEGLRDVASEIRRGIRTHICVRKSIQFGVCRAVSSQQIGRIRVWTDGVEIESIDEFRF